MAGGRVGQIDPTTLDAAERILGYRFRDRALLIEALTHASIAESRRVSNERLEFLGDAALGMIVCEHIFRAFPELLEGDMTKIKSAVVSRRTCALVAGTLGLEQLLSLGKGMQVREGLPASLAAAALESIIGAVFLDSGSVDEVKRFLMPHLIPLITRAAESGHQQNFKSVLQQHAQQHMEGGPAYIVLDERGPDHAKAFEICVEIGGKRFESCWGSSKKAAEQQAALNALRALGLAVDGPDGEVVIAGLNGENSPGAAAASGVGPGADA